MRKILHLNLPTAVLAAFHRAEYIPGYVYVEAPSPADVVALFDGVNYVAKFSQKPYISWTPIDSNDRLPLLRLDSGTRETILQRRHSWVRVLKRGRYHGDLGYVIDITPADLTLTIALIPRIQFSPPGKRSYRPQQRLFVKRELDQHAVRYETRNKLILIHQTSESMRIHSDMGLCELELNFGDVSFSAVHPLETELDLFRSCKYRPCRLLAFQDGFLANWTVGEEVKVITGPYASMVGLVCEVAGSVIQIDVPQLDDLSTITISATSHEIRRNLRLYDFVKVVHGRLKDNMGFLIRYESPTIYSRGTTLKATAGYANHDDDFDDVLGDDDIYDNIDAPAGLDEYISVLWSPQLQDYVRIIQQDCCTVPANT